MKHYDTIIIGAGIAGTGLAHNLSKTGYKGNILVLDKGYFGNNKGHNLRATFKEIIDEYNLPYSQVYDSMKIGAFDKIYFEIKEKIYAINYEKSAESLIKRSNAEFKQENALDVKGKILKTNKSIYSFKNLIDCTGSSFFLKKKLHQTLPFRYWIGDLKVIENKTNIRTDALYYLFGEDGFVEEFNPMKNKIIQGNWQYVKKVDFNLIKPHNKTMLNKIMKDNPKILKQEYAILPVSPVLPLVYKNIAFLGDCFGNAMSSTSFGVGVTLDSSIMLANAIKKDNLKNYEKEWKKKYLEPYTKYLVSKYNLYHNNKFSQFIKKAPSIPDIMEMLKSDPNSFRDLMKDGTYPQRIPEEMKKKVSKGIILTSFLYYSYLKLRYTTMNYL